MANSNRKQFVLSKSSSFGVLPSETGITARTAAYISRDTWHQLRNLREDKANQRTTQEHDSIRTLIGRFKRNQGKNWAFTAMKKQTYKLPATHGSIGECPARGKLQYPDEETAQAAAKRFRKKYGGKLTTFLCRQCHLYHNGHKLKTWYVEHATLILTEYLW